MEYKLFIENRVRDQEGKVTERAVIVDGSNGFKTEAIYNPNKETGPFNSKGPFDTSFSIVHPFREAAKEIAQHFMCVNNSIPPGQIEYAPQMKYDRLHQDQQKLFGNILFQELRKLDNASVESMYKTNYAVTEA